MKVIINKNIKYKGETYSRGSNINIEESDLEEFISKKVVDEDLMNKLEELKEIEVTVDDLSEEMDTQHMTGIDDITKGDIVDILTEKGIEHNARDKKEDLYDLLIGSE